MTVTTDLRVATILRALGCLACCVAFPSAPRAAESTTSSPRLDMIWSVPSSDNQHPDGKHFDLEIEGMAEAADGGIILRGISMDDRGKPHDVLLDHAEEAKPTAAKPFAVPPAKDRNRFWSWISGADRAPRLKAFAAAEDGGTWIGGSTNNRLDIGSSPLGEAYVAKLDRDRRGASAWILPSSKDQFRPVDLILPTTDGAALIAGAGRLVFRSWFSRVSRDGVEKQDHVVGNGMSIAVAALAGGGAIVAASVASQGDERTDEIDVWRFAPDGRLSDATPIRAGIPRFRYGHGGELVASAAPDGAYVVTAFLMGSTDPALPIGIARVDAAGTLAWSRTLDDTAAGRGPGHSACDPALVTLATGDALLACETDGNMRLDVFDRRDGTRRSARVAMPTCQQGRPERVLLAQSRTGALYAAGSGERGICSWLARLVLPTAWTAQ